MTGAPTAIRCSCCKKDQLVRLEIGILACRACDWVAKWPKQEVRT